MNAVVVCTLSQWLQVYNVRAVQLVASLLGISITRSTECRTITLCAPCGAILRTVSITPTTKVADICLDTEQFFLEGTYETLLELPSLVWKHVSSDGQLTVMTSKFEGIKDTVLKGHIHRVNSVSWHPDGTKLASGSWDTTIRIWDVTLDSSKCIAICQGHTYAVNTIQWNPSGTKLASGSYATTIRIWDTISWECLHILQGHAHFVLSIGWHPCKNWIASGSYDKTIRIWDTTSWECLHVLKGHTDAIWAIHWNPSGTQLASGSGNKTIRIWNIDSLTGKCVHVLKSHTSSVLDIQWNPTGTLLASASWDKTIRIWDTTTWICTTILKGHTRAVSSISWNPSGTRLVNGSGKTIHVYNTDSWKCLHELQCASTVYSVEWHLRGTYLASGLDGGAIRCWK